MLSSISTLRFKDFLFKTHQPLQLLLDNITTNSHLHSLFTFLTKITFVSFYFCFLFHGNLHFPTHFVYLEPFNVFIDSSHTCSSLLYLAFLMDTPTMCVFVCVYCCLYFHHSLFAFIMISSCILDFLLRNHTLYLIYHSCGAVGLLVRHILSIF